MTRMPVHRRDFFGDLGNQSENSERCQSSHERVSGEPSHGVGLVFPILRTLAITWPQGLRGEEYNVTAAAQVYGVVGQDRE